MDQTDPKRWYNAATKRSTYEKPPELMSTTERADATTKWKECVTGDGRTFYHNRETRARNRRRLCMFPRRVRVFAARTRVDSRLLLATEPNTWLFFYWRWSGVQQTSDDVIGRCAYVSRCDWTVRVRVTV